MILLIGTGFPVQYKDVLFVESDLKKRKFRIIIIINLLIYHPGMHVPTACSFASAEYTSADK